MLQGIVARFQSIESGTNGAVYTPGLVCRVLEFADPINTPDSTVTGTPDDLRPLYYIRPGQETRRFGPDSCTITCDLEIFVMIAAPFTEPSIAPSGGVPEAWGAMQADLAGDAAFAVFQNVSFGVDGTRLVDDTLVVDYDDRWIDGWCNVELRFIVRYRLSRLPVTTNNR